LNVIDRASKKSFLPTFHDPVFTVFIGDNREYDTNVLRYDYESMTTPFTVYEFSFVDHKHKLIKQNEIPGGFSSADYVSQRMFAKAKDGTMVPISLVYRKTTSLSASTPLLVYGYGSYGYSMEPDFNLNELSLLDRGFVYAIAHVRGGSEMGRSWYLNGRQDKKKNTFTDFISATEALHTKGISSPAHTYAMGGSAGGLLMGSVMNMRPDLYNGMIALVPFVDVVTTMLDTSIPLTTGEFDEWGNPAEKKAYTYIKSYSPYDNVEAKPYPNVLVMTGFHDSQVQYWEPMKWVAKLREKKTDQNLLLFQTNMEAGHGGKMGRFERLKETALRYAFLLMLEGKTDTKAK
jgi:oligopeptidase B